MTAEDLCFEARKRGLRLEPRGDKLAVIPADRLAPDFAAVLREHKPALLHWLNRPPCPGLGVIPLAPLPLDPVEPRPTPLDRQRVIDYLHRQDDLAAWLVRRESAYYDGPGRAWDCAAFAYAAARDAACWQLNRGEREMLDLLEGFEEVAGVMRSSKPVGSQSEQARNLA